MTSFTFESGISRNKKHLLENGWIIGNIPNYIYEALRVDVLSKISSSESVHDSFLLISSMSDDEFRASFPKWNRILSDAIARQVESCCQSMRDLLDVDDLRISPVSLHEIRNNKTLTIGDLDLFYRIARAGKKDTGPAHYDELFWDLVSGTESEPLSPSEYNARWKVWIPLYNCSRENMLHVVSGSHHEAVPTFWDNSVTSSYISKGSNQSKRPSISPVWLKDNEQRFICPQNLGIGKFILFHDKLVHKGPENLRNDKNLPRISCEFTLLT